MTCSVEAEEASHLDVTAPEGSLDALRQDGGTTVSTSVQDLDVRLVRLPGLQPVLAVVNVDKRVDPQALRSLVQFHAGRGLLVCPALLPRSEWGILDGLATEEESKPLAQPARPLCEVLANAHPAPRAARRWLLSILRSNGLVLESMEMSTKLSMHVRLGVAVEVVREGLEILFAMHGQPWVEDATLFDRFDAHISGAASITPNALYDYLELRGAAALAHLQHRALTKTRPVRIDLEPSRKLIDRLEAHVLEHYSTTAECRRRRHLKLGVTLLPIPVVLVGALALLISTLPETPMEADPPADRCGGITGHYFQGEAFDKEVTSRFDRGIGLNSSKTVAPKVPADHFSVRWEGSMFFAADGRYSLCTESDDGCRLHFNGRTLIDDWKVHPAKTTCKTVHVRKGWYPISVAYFEQGGTATMRLLRGPDPENAKLVPAGDLCCRD